jgi:hypothetical protein
VWLGKKRLVHGGDKCSLRGRDHPCPWSSNGDRMRTTTANPWHGDDNVWVENKS